MARLRTGITDFRLLTPLLFCWLTFPLERSQFILSTTLPTVMFELLVVLLERTSIRAKRKPRDCRRWYQSTMMWGCEIGIDQLTKSVKIGKHQSGVRGWCFLLVLEFQFGETD
jgi:hypothetical protein